MSLFRSSRECSICTYIQDRLDAEELDTGLLEKATLSVRLKEPNESSEEVKWALLELSVRQAVGAGDVTSTHAFSITTCAFNCR